jgi:hypothetical protein
MEGLTPVQISELVTLLEDAISNRVTRLELPLSGDPAGTRLTLHHEIDHLEAELAWIQWMRENYPGHEDSGFPALSVDEHVQGMRAGITRWLAKLKTAREKGDDPNYIQSLQNSTHIVGEILDLFTQVRA